MKTIFRLLLAAALAVGALVANITPASAAGTQCTPYYGTSQTQGCVTVSAGMVMATLEAYSGKFMNYSIVLEQCRTDLTNCITFNSMNKTSTTDYDEIPYATCSFGHIYRVHASWYDYLSGQPYVDARSPWVAC